MQDGVARRALALGMYISISGIVTFKAAESLRAIVRDLPLDRFIATDCPHFYRGALTGESEEEFATRLADNLEQLVLAEGPDTIAAFFAATIAIATIIV